MTGKRAKSSSPYSVGYKRPPLHSRFKKGQSGNRSGRRQRRTSTVDDMIAEELHSKVLYQENGRVRKSTKLRLMIKHVINQALSGNFKPRAILLKINDRLDLLALTPEPSLLGVDLSRMSEVELSDLYRKVVAAAD